MTRETILKIERVVSLGLAITVLIHAIFQVLPIINAGTHWTSFILAIGKHIIVILFIYFNSPPKEVSLNLKTIFGILLSFASPIFISIDGASPNKTVFAFAIACSLFYGSVLCFTIIRLGRSFSVLPGLRSLKIDWPFSEIRHPMYGSYIHLVLMAVLYKTDLTNFLAAALLFVGLHIRAQEEERLLSRDSHFQKFVNISKNRFFSFYFSLPLIILGMALFWTRPLQNKDKTVELNILFPYPVMSLNPLVYDEWHSVFLGNHIYKRLTDAPHRNIPGVTEEITVDCLNEVHEKIVKGCIATRVSIKFRSIKDCDGYIIPRESLKQELLEVLQRYSWIFPKADLCELDNTDLCLQGPYVEDLQRRLQSIYLRFGWRENQHQKRIGIGPYCLMNATKNANGEYLSGTLVPLDSGSTLPKINFEVNSSANDLFDLGLFGYIETPTHREIPSHTPLGYYLVSNPKYEQKCMPWDTPDAKQVISSFLYNSNLTYKDLEVFRSLLPSGGKKICGNKIFFPTHRSASKLTIMIPSFIPNCELLTEELNDLWSQKKWDSHIMAQCGDTTDLIKNKVVAKKGDWHAYITPLSPGYPGRQAIEVQYFSKNTSGSWISESLIPEKNYSLISVGKSAVILKRERYCNISPSPLGLGDLFISDLKECTR